MLFFIVIGAFIFARFIVLTQFPTALAGWVKDWGLSPVMVIVRGDGCSTSCSAPSSRR